MTNSKNSGGMGFKDFTTMNLALLAKQAWRLANNPNALWVQIIKGKYFPGECLWKAKKTKGCSWAWESLLEGRDLLLRHGLWQIGDGSDVRIFTDSWIDKEHVLRNQPDLEMDATVNTLINQNQRSWDVQKIPRYFPRNIAAKIIATPLLPEGEPNILIWPYTKNGQYEVKTGYHVEKTER